MFAPGDIVTVNTDRADTPTWRVVEGRPDQNGLILIEELKYDCRFYVFASGMKIVKHRSTAVWNRDGF